MPLSHFQLWSEPSVEQGCADLTRKLLQLGAANPPHLKWLRSAAFEAFSAHYAPGWKISQHQSWLPTIRFPGKKKVTTSGCSCEFWGISIIMFYLCLKLGLRYISVVQFSFIFVGNFRCIFVWTGKASIHVCNRVLFDIFVASLSDNFAVSMI